MNAFIGAPLNLPEWMPALYWADFEFWGAYLGGDYRVGAALKGGALERSFSGPRGGQRFRVADLEAYRAWAVSFNARAGKLHEAKMAESVRRALGESHPAKRARREHLISWDGAGKARPFCGQAGGRMVSVRSLVTCKRCLGQIVLLYGERLRNAQLAGGAQV